METTFGSKSKILRPGSPRPGAYMEADAITQWLGSLMKGKRKGQGTGRSVTSVGRPATRQLIVALRRKAIRRVKQLKRKTLEKQRP